MLRAVVALFGVVTLAVTAGGCDCSPHRDIQSEINIMVRRNDALVPPAMERLVAYGRAAIPQIETALHTASITGRQHLITALDRIGEGESTQILIHFAVYDTSPAIRTACEQVLNRWANDGRNAGRAEIARVALSHIADKRAHGEAPVVFGKANVAGAPPTVGAVAPVGAALDTPEKPAR